MYDVHGIHFLHAAFKRTGKDNSQQTAMCARYENFFCGAFGSRVMCCCEPKVPAVGRKAAKLHEWLIGKHFAGSMTEEMVQEVDTSESRTTDRISSASMQA